MVKRRDNEGMALVLALLATILVAAAVGLVMDSVQREKRNADNAIHLAVLDEACKAGAEIGLQQIWDGYLRQNNNRPGNFASYLAFINGIVSNNEDINRSGLRDGNERDFDGDGSFEVGNPVELVSADTPRELESGAQISRLLLERTDDVTGCQLTFTVTAAIEGRTRVATQSVRVSGERFAGFQYAVLANNINCILCHAEFSSVDMLNNSDPDAYGTFDRIKIASLESLLIRKTEADSRCAGTVYTRGNVYNKDGSLLDANGIASSTFKGWSFDPDTGKIIQDEASGRMSLTGLHNADNDSEGLPEQRANLYLNYPEDRTAMTDGELPTKFPAPFPDDDGDRYVGDAEFEKYVRSANGSVRFDLPENPGSSVTAGVAYGVPKGTTYSGSSLPTASNDALQDISSDGSYDGNLILVGTEHDPIVIENSVAIDGDLVIKGQVKGRGQLMVSGNVYVVGDVTYADGEGTFGKAADGTENAFGIQAGGSILMGDYLTIRAKNNYKTTKISNRNYKDTVDTGVWQGEFVRVDTESATSTLDSGQKTQVGYFDPGASDAGGPVGATRREVYYKGQDQHTKYVEPEGQFSFTTSEIMLFNRMERQKWAPPGHEDHNPTYYIPNYTPRYYQLRDDAPIYQYVVTNSTSSDLKEHAVNYLSPGVEAITDGLNEAAVHSLSPSQGWVGEDALRRMWFEDEAWRRQHLDDKGRAPWKFDGLLYTNNCVFGVTRGNLRHKSATYGTMIIRGAIVCADLGLLVADNGHENPSDPLYSGLRLYYDKRVDAFMNVEDPTVVTFRRVVYRYLQS